MAKSARQPVRGRLVGGLFHLKPGDVACCQSRRFSPRKLSPTSLAASVRAILESFRGIWKRSASAYVLRRKLNLRERFCVMFSIATNSPVRLGIGKESVT